MYRIEITLKSHNKPSLKNGLKQLQRIVNWGCTQTPSLVKNPQRKVWFQGSSQNSSYCPSPPFQADPVSFYPPLPGGKGLPLKRLEKKKSVRVTPKGVQKLGTMDSPKLYGKIGLPPLKKVFTVLRSPHIDKKSREQFQWVRYKERVSFFCMNRNLTLTLLSIVKYSQFPGIELHLQMKYITFIKRY
jgi:ribosomal protein S10